MNALYTIRMAQYLSRMREINRKTLQSRDDIAQMRQLVDNLIKTAEEARSSLNG